MHLLNGSGSWASCIINWKRSGQLCSFSSTSLDNAATDLIVMKWKSSKCSMKGEFKDISYPARAVLTTFIGSDSISWINVFLTCSLLVASNFLYNLLIFFFKSRAAWCRQLSFELDWIWVRILGIPEAVFINWFTKASPLLIVPVSWEQSLNNWE